MYVLICPETEELITHKDLRDKRFRFSYDPDRSGIINERTHKIYKRKNSAEKAAEKINGREDFLASDRKVEVRSIQDFPIGYRVAKVGLNEIPHQIDVFRITSKKDLESSRLHATYEEAKKELYEEVERKKRRMEQELDKAAHVEDEGPELKHVTDEKYGD